MPGRRDSRQRAIGPEGDAGAGHADGEGDGDRQIAPLDPEPLDAAGLVTEADGDPVPDAEAPEGEPVAVPPGAGPQWPSSPPWPPTPTTSPPAAAADARNRTI